GLFAAFDGLRTELLGETLDTAFGVDQLLPSGEKRMAIRADFQVKLGLGRPCFPRVAAGTPRFHIVVFGMDALFHDENSLQETVIIAPAHARQAFGPRLWAFARRLRRWVMSGNRRQATARSRKARLATRDCRQTEPTGSHTSDPTADPGVRRRWPQGLDVRRWLEGSARRWSSFSCLE